MHDPVSRLPTDLDVTMNSNKLDKGKQLQIIPQPVSSRHTSQNNFNRSPPLNQFKNIQVYKKKYAYGTIELGEGDTFKILE